MSTYKELVYLVLDELKLNSEDSTYTEDHIIFLLEKYRALVLKQRYSDIKKQIPESNYQTICLDLIKVPTITEESCGGYYLKSKQEIPNIMKISNTAIYPIDYFSGNITYIDRNRMKYTGYNKYLQNIIYASTTPDNYLYLKSSNPQYLYLEQVKLTGIFEDPKSVLSLNCSKDNESVCDVMSMVFPMEYSLIPSMIELVVKELLGSIYRPKDENNDSKDNLSNIPTK